jgi:hypothetical protein
MNTQNRDHSSSACPLLRAAIRTFTRSSRPQSGGEGPQPVPAAKGVRTLAVLDAARESAKQGRTVAITDLD